MHRIGHIGTGILDYAPIGTVLIARDTISFAIVGGLTAIALSLVPDVDEYLSTLDHRGPTHTVWFVLVCAVVVGAAGSLAVSDGSSSRTYIWVVFGAFGLSSLGSHLLVDGLTPMGIRPFRPVHPAEYLLQWTKSDNPRANLALLGLGVLASGLAIAPGIL